MWYFIYDADDSEQIVNFLAVITIYGRVTEPCNQNVTLASSPNVNENRGSYQQRISGECAVSQHSDINDRVIISVNRRMLRRRV